MEERIARMLPLLDERLKRQFLANEAISYGYGGVSVVSRLSGVSRPTIIAGIKEIKRTQEEFNKTQVVVEKTRKSGGGRKYIEEKYPEIEMRIREIIDGKTYGDTMKILSYTSESLRKITTDLLGKYGINVSYVTVGEILKAIGYSKKANQQVLQKGESHPDRNTQIEYINTTASMYLEEGEPVIYVDTKKKENIEEYKNNGGDYRTNINIRNGLDYGALMKKLGEISTYDLYSLDNKTGFANVGTSDDTNAFDVENIFRWWEIVGKHNFSEATKLMIICDCGGSNSERTRMWKYQLQQFACRTGLETHISHLPPGTSKWNKVEHKLFFYISKNGDGEPVIDVQTSVYLIGTTKTINNFEVICIKGDTSDKLAKKVTDKDFDAINVDEISPFHLWNYKISPY
ncbi:MAG: ISAzo13 family transposase [Oscillospiraceae bacterium]